MTIPELGTITATHPPIIVLTSNRTRDLHDAVKRRCLYHWIDYPSPQREVEIVRRRVKGASETLAVQVADAVSRMRDSDVQKPPGIAEAIDWLAALSLLGIETLDAAAVGRTLGSVLKYDEDQEVIRAAGLEQLVQAMTDFGVETIHLDLPPLAAALSRRLHDAGVPMTPERPADFARALALVRPVSRRRLYWTARSVFVSDQAHVAAFDARVLLGLRRGGRDVDPRAPDEDAHRAARLADDRRRGRRRGGRPRASRARPSPAPRAQRRATRTAPRSRCRSRWRATRSGWPASASTRSTPHELAQLYRLMTRLEVATPLRRTRRHERARHGRRIDMRRTLRASLRTGGEPLRLARRRRRVVPRRLVMLCDISGSMEPYARAYLQFLTSAAGSGPHAEAFVFATRLTRLTRALAGRHPERAIQRAAAAAPDWSSGTRIGDALKAFNDRHGRRGMARGAVVVILSDGWERGDPALVGPRDGAPRAPRPPDRVGQPARQRERVLRAGRRDGRGAAALHALVSGHSFDGARRGRRGDRRRGDARRSSRRPRPRSPSRGRARRRCPAARSRCRAGTARARATPRRDG